MIGAPTRIDGVDILLSPHLPSKTKRVQFRFPKSRRKRIRKKWSKQERNWREVELPCGVRMGEYLVVNQPMLALLRKHARPPAEQSPSPDVA